MTEATWRAGGCHCSAVRFEVMLPEPAEAQSCTCSICEKTGFVHLIVPESRFGWLSRRRQPHRAYTFNTRTAQHLFCEVCAA